MQHCLVLQQPESNLLACAGPQVIESDGSEEAAEAVENLLESYFIQIDSTYDRLVSIGKADFSFQAKLALSAGSNCLQTQICRLKLAPSFVLIASLVGCPAADYIQDTEEYINIELDSARNRLIKLEILITAATFAIACFGLIAGELATGDAAPLCMCVEHAAALQESSERT